MRKWLPYIWLLFGLAEFGHAQPQQGLSNLRRRVLAAAEDSVMLDSLTVIPGTLRISALSGDLPVDTALYYLENNRLYWRKAPASLPDTVEVTYRVLPYDLYHIFRQLDSTNAQPSTDSLLIVYAPFDREAPLVDFRGLDYSGTFARGISLGNRQDLVLNSSFNLQLAGDLGEGVEILAAISDENIPLQPEGNTQQLQEFDRIFVQLSKGGNRLIAGDYELRRPESYFLNYFKKLQGATFSNQAMLGAGTLRTDASVAIARGQFARQTIDGQEGNQGPYKLRGARAERFIIVLSGTERVWLDGQLLTRGLEEDYIIDYNRGELAFTNRRLITKDSRIIVEFEYSDQSYLRSLYAFNSTYRHDKLRLSVNLLSQQDSRNSTGLQELSDAEKRILAMAGDDVGLSVASGIDTLDAFNPVRAMYIAIDTLLPCGRRDTVLLYSVDPGKARLTARFSYVGPGAGNYMLDPQQSANERVYRWVEPDPLSCAPRGDHAPVYPLIAPQQQLMLSAGGEYRFSPSAGLRTEIALSRNDLNRFSSLNQEDDTGLAFYTQFDKAFRLSADTNGWRLLTDLTYELVQADFRAFNPYRDPEFLRDWSLADQEGFGSVAPAREHLLRGGFAFRREGAGALAYRFGLFFRDSLYQGLQHLANFSFRRGGFAADGQGSLLNSTESRGRSRFFRPRIDIRQTLPWLAGWQLGFSGEMEKNDRYEAPADTISPGSFYYHVLRTYLRSPESGKLKLALSYQRRQDYRPSADIFLPSSLAGEFNINGDWQAGRAFRLNGNFSYRRLGVSGIRNNGPEPGETLLGRSDATLNLWRGALRSSTTYELGSGQEPKLEFTFIRVNKGEGTHIWLDSLYNNDGVVQPNEMEIAPFADQADFVKVTTFTDDFIRTDYVSLNQGLQLNPKAVWHNAGGIRQTLARFSTQSSLRINRKTQRSSGASAWNPFQFGISDSALVASSSNIRNVLFFNRADPVYDIQLIVEDNSSKMVQTTGFESRRRTERALRARWNLSKAFSMQFGVSQGLRISDSEFFQNKDYRLGFLTAEPQLTLLPSQQFRAILRYQYQYNRNQLPETGERSRQHDLNLETTYNKSSSTSLRLRLSLVQIQFEGQPNSPVGFAILNGLSPGRNFLWNLSLDRQLVKNIQLRFSYEGRRTGESRIVHVGRAQVAATF